MLPAAMLLIIMGTKNGDTRDGPRVSSFSVSFTKVCMPPMPLPTYTPKRSGATAPLRPLWRMACSAAASA